MGFPKLTEEEIKKLKIVEGFKLHEDCLFLIVEAPSKRTYVFDVNNLDRRFFAGIIFTYPISLQKAMWHYVIKNFIKPKERERWCRDLQFWLSQVELEDNLVKR